MRPAMGTSYVPSGNVLSFTSSCSPSALNGNVSMMPTQCGLIGEACDLVDNDPLAGGIRDSSVPICEKSRIEVLWAGHKQRVRQLVQDLALILIQSLSRLQTHEKDRDDALQHGDFGADSGRHNHRCTESNKARLRVCAARGVYRGMSKSTNELTREVLQAGKIKSRAVPGINPHLQWVEPVEGSGKFVARVGAAIPRLDTGDERVVIDPGTEHTNIKVAVDDSVFKVVYRIGDVIGKVHDLCFNAGAKWRGLRSQPVKRCRVVCVIAKLRSARRVKHGIRERPRVFATRIETRTREVKTVTAAIPANHLRFKPGKHTQGLRIALKSADVDRPRIESRLTIVPKRRVA